MMTTDETCPDIHIEPATDTTRQDNVNINAFNESVVIIEKMLLGVDTEKYAVFASGLDSINYIYSKIKQMSIDIQSTDKTDVDFTPEDFKILSTNVLLQIEKAIVFTPLSDNMREALSAMILFIYNWNSNTVRNNEIEYTTKKINKISLGIVTMSDTISILKTLNGTVIDQIKTQIPAIELSKQYLALPAT